MPRSRAGRCRRIRPASLFSTPWAQHAKLYTPPGSGPTLIRSLLEEASAHGTPYYRILAATALGESLPLFDANASSARPVFASATPQDKFVQGFIDFRLPERGLSTAKSRLASLSPETLASLARSEASKGKYIESLRLLHLAVGRENSHPSRTTLETLYPLAYREEMEEVLKDVKVPQPLFYGLIRGGKLLRRHDPFRSRRRRALPAHARDGSGNSPAHRAGKPRTHRPQGKPPPRFAVPEKPA